MNLLLPFFSPVTFSYCLIHLIYSRAPPPSAVVVLIPIVSGKRLYRQRSVYTSRAFILPQYTREWKIIVETCSWRERSRFFTRTYSDISFSRAAIRVVRRYADSDYDSVGICVCGVVYDDVNCRGSYHHDRDRGLYKVYTRGTI